MTKLLLVEDLNKSFGKTQILNNLSFHLNKGEIVGFLGSNGAGKSTTLRSILGIYAYEKGNVNYYVSNASTIRSIGYLPEERGMYKTITVSEMLTYFAELKGYQTKNIQEKISKYLKKFKLEGKENTKIGDLSKGMSQKVQFIGAIIHEPEILILDEPFSGLDPISQNLFKEEIKNLAKKGVGILFSSHQMNLVEELCTRVYLLHEGEFILSGTVDEIKEQNGGLICSITKCENNKKLQKELECEHIEENQNELKLYLSRDKNQQEILKILSNYNFEEMSLERTSLHDIYIKIVGDNR